MIYLTSLRVIVSKAFANGGIGLSAEGRVITLDSNGSVIIKEIMASRPNTHVSA